MLEIFLKHYALDEIVKIVFSVSKGHKFIKSTLKPVEIKGELMWQVENFDGKKAFHENLRAKDVLKYIKTELIENYREINIIKSSQSIAIKEDKKGRVIDRVTNTKCEVKANTTHNVKKQYLLEEGMQIDALVDLGVFTKEYKVVKAKYDKYKQINKFVEIIDHEFKNINIDGDFTILDFGCGKSYLTFILYYYFAFIKKVNVNIIGYDLKEDVVDDCNKIANKYGYKNLSFILGDVANTKRSSKKVDMMITLHACDTATDHALYKAISEDVKYIFSVPCCQHEVNAQIKTKGELGIFTGHGLIKERFSALLTDALRLEVLKDMGYKVDAIEFVDFSHSPKNLMIRAVKQKRVSSLKLSQNTEKLIGDLNVSPTLINLLK